MNLTFFLPDIMSLMNSALAIFFFRGNIDPFLWAICKLLYLMPPFSSLRKEICQLFLLFFYMILQFLIISRRLKSFLASLSVPNLKFIGGIFNSVDIHQASSSEFMNIKFYIIKCEYLIYINKTYFDQNQTGYNN